MLILNCAVFLTIFVTCYGQNFFQNARLRRFPMQAAINLKNRIKEKFNQYRERNTQSVCYDIVGCFNLPHKNSPLQKIPENPKQLETKFYLFTRDTDFSNPEIIYYDDHGKSLRNSTFKFSKPLKLIAHGYMSRWNEKGSIIMANAYLKLYDCNVVLMDWHIGARGPQYATAAANTELVGRQLGILLMKMVDKGMDARKIHLIGFSLGAHVCGTASESLKVKGHLLGRITGLDAASPLFRNNYLREKYKKLDRSDATFVDVIHTDGSPFVTDGFGLWEPIGHVDFFPNGGQEQPGCNDIKDAIVVSHFGTQLLASIDLSPKTSSANGILQLQLLYFNRSVIFNIPCEFDDPTTSDRKINALSVAEYNTLDKSVQEIRARISYLDLGREERIRKNETEYVPTIYFDKISARDMYGNSWQYCEKGAKIEDKTGQQYGLLTVTLSRTSC